MASFNEIELKVVTPEGLKLTEKVKEFSAPSVDGEFTVLPGHVPLLAALRTGIASFVNASGEKISIAVGPGFARLDGDSASLVVDDYHDKASIEPIRLRADFKDVDEAIVAFDGNNDSAEYLKLVEKEAWLATLLELYGDAPPPRILLPKDAVQVEENYRNLDSATDDAAPGDAAPAKE